MNKMRYLFHKTITFCSKYWGFLDKQNLIFSFILSLFFTLIFFDEQRAEFMIFLIPQRIDFFSVLLSLSPFLPQFLEFFKERQWENKKKINRWFNWGDFSLNIMYIYLFHAIFCCYSFRLLIQVVERLHFSSFPELSILVLIFFGLSFLHFISAHSLIKMSYQKKIINWDKNI